MTKQSYKISTHKRKSIKGAKKNVLPPYGVWVIEVTLEVSSRPLEVSV